MGRNSNFPPVFLSFPSVLPGSGNEDLAITARTLAENSSPEGKNHQQLFAWTQMAYRQNSNEMGLKSSEEEDSRMFMVHS